MITFFLKFKKNILLSIIILSLTILVMTLTFLFTNDEELNESSINKNLNQQEDIEKSISEESKIIKKTEKSAEKILPKNQSKLNDPVTKTKVKDLAKLKEKFESSNLDPVDTINELHEGLIKVSKKEIYDYKKFMPIINNTYDIEKMLNMILGNAWKNSNLEKQKKISLVFEEYVAKNYLKRFVKIKDVKFKIKEKKNIKNKFIIVKTNLIPYNGDEVSINYLLVNKNGKWKIFDVLLAGSVSEIATKKSEFSGFLKEGKIDKLIEALNKKNSILLN
ncbi:MAG: hypothetical protein CMM99_00790 [Rickettsiales bacterium]|nr:hypothetical protein [Rickettsiales bacterium]